MIDLEYCRQLDGQDELAAFRDEFQLNEGQIYLVGNSLGAQPKAAAQRAAQVVEQEWGRDQVRSWNTAGWFELPLRLGDRIAPLIGAAPGEVAVTDSTSINLFKVLAAALHMQSAQAERRVILTERSNFPTDIYIAQGLARWLEQGYEVRLIDDPDDIAAALTPDVAVMMLTHVNYRTGRLLDMQALTRRAHEAGVLAIWDLAHSAGAVPVDLNACQADFAVGCTYKYFNAGPGAPAFLWVPKRHQAAFQSPLTGWWGHARPFAMEPGFQASPGVRAALCGTQPMVSLALVEVGVDMFARAGMAAVRRKSLALTDLFMALVEQECGVELALVSPRDHALRGSQVCYAHPHGYGLMQALIQRGVVGDYREPDILRFGFTPLYTRFEDVWQAVRILRELLTQRDFDLDPQRAAVT
ncbi:kynureninase [Alcaligenes sp. SDU_A2]|uniref:kynureninase n=1 Tax=Alcaligenes sp. SDU_A2 TaxID=3136634 RepID=UPI00311EF80C